MEWVVYCESYNHYITYYDLYYDRHKVTVLGRKLPFESRKLPFLVESYRFEYKVNVLSRKLPIFQKFIIKWYKVTVSW